MADRFTSHKARANLPLILSIVAACGLVVISFLPKLSGWSAWGPRIALLVLAVIGPIATQMEKRRAEDAQRFEVQVKIEPGNIDGFPDMRAFIDECALAEERDCLASLDAWEKRSRLEDGMTFGDEHEPLDGLSVAELIDLEKRQENGESLTGEERATLHAAQNETRKALEPIFSALLTSGKQEPQTTAQYRDEVSNYVANLRSSLAHMAEDGFCELSLGRIQLHLHNPTDRPFESVVMEVAFPEGVKIYGWGPADSERAILPTPPDSYGTARWRGLPDSFPLAPAFPPIHTLGLRPTSEPALVINGATVRFRAIRVRPKATESLHELIVITTSPTGSTLPLSWVATDGSALGQASGSLSLTISPAPSVESLIEAAEAALPAAAR
jgi:hypothetical protein